VGAVAGIDQDAGARFTYSISPQDDAGGRFTVDSRYGWITVANSSLLGWDGPHAFSIKVVVTDQSGLSGDQWVTVSLTNVNSIAHDFDFFNKRIQDSKTITYNSPSKNSGM